MAGVHYHQGASCDDDGIIHIHTTGYIVDGDESITPEEEIDDVLLWMERVTHWTGERSIAPDEKDYDFWLWMIARGFPTEKVIHSDGERHLHYLAKYKLEKTPPVERNYTCAYCGADLGPENLKDVRQSTVDHMDYFCPSCENETKIILNRVLTWPEV